MVIEKSMTLARRQYSLTGEVARNVAAQTSKNSDATSAAMKKAAEATRVLFKLIGSAEGLQKE
ncbi:hypothetical protein SARC_05749 [Sphaeroforma arctica JP610]|uniref:Uncharacterized protein n=1 Tax=Sphaeroforma arctica JP610 TaxID=667725 RepID=A0A0L0G178_9EUKA|nr:hypothetical protein SARC_05749 [Sphaeroforma arctica JP610]KNC81958.1 hypothetical protein SARC_05749 [Sphaeroforma arctica JP610]|eukprot:XP_014155860.1 hypothetical protein SARC_05749 [Sphaeroforma arctica JP610]